MRTDTTVVEALLWDSVRVLTRIMLRAQKEFGTASINHARRAKRRSLAILNAGTTERRMPLYKDLLKVTHKTRSCAKRPHTDIIRKDRRDTYYGHKVTLSTGRSALVLDVVVEAGNPADSTLAVRSAERHAALFGHAPERAAFDGGFASKKNLEEIKNEETAEVCFSKPCGIPLEE